MAQQAVKVESQDEAKAKADKEAIASIERRLRALKGDQPSSSSTTTKKCGMCGSPAQNHCPDCLKLAGSGVPDNFCDRCLLITHKDNDRFAGHKPVAI